MGKAFKVGDDISTDHIIPGRFAHLRSNLPELAKHALEDTYPSFTQKVKPGDFLVAGKNFGLGSSREHAAIVLKMAGVKAVLARSCARIFFRNAINVGLPVFITDTSAIDEGDKLELDWAVSVVKDVTKGIELSFGRIPPVMLKILEEGGLVPFIQKYKNLELPGG
jgi:3-isopropylmalate/(R)-2-methylmalate dehydratase small subunit